jgi:class 3 adenylate cyclase
VVFADLTGSTEVVAEQDPERMRAFLTRFYDGMANEISLAGGTVEKFAGDAVMAVFGVPEALEDHVERALHAALAMQRQTHEVLGLGLDLRIGIDTGEVVVGAAREGSSFATGAAVNVAARLEQAAESGSILVGERTVGLASGAFEFGALQRVEAKGIAGGVACRTLVRALTLMRPRGLPGRPPAFVGRDEELARLLAAFQRARASQRPELVTIAGAPGVGKSRLVRELWASLGVEAPEALRRTGRCLPYGHARTYAPIAEILKEQFGILDSDSPERSLALLGGREILALTLGIEDAGDLHPMDARDLLHDTWVEFVAELAAEQPLVLLVEDLHWAEPPLLDLLERTLGEVAAPVLLLATGRPEFLDRTPTWGRGRVPAEWVWLEPLRDEDVARWLVEIGAGDAPASVRKALAKAEGNPLFLEELVGVLIANGVLRGDNWEVERLARGVDLPDTVHAVLAARIDALPATEKVALQAAAVIGRAFWPSAVRELVRAEPDFRLLEQRDFVRRRPGSSLEGDRELVIKHALTREVALGSLSRRERVRLHAAFADWLERRGGGRDEDAAALAHHYAEATPAENADLAWGDEPGRYEALRASAIRWLRRAAELATGRFEIDGALALNSLALELTDDATLRIDLLIERAHMQSVRYDMERVRESLEHALELGPDAATTAWIYARLAAYGLGRRYMWKQPPSLDTAEGWLAKALELSEPGSRARGYVRIAQALSRPLENEGAAEEARAIGEAVGDQALVFMSLEANADAATHARRYQEARAWSQRHVRAASQWSRAINGCVAHFNAVFFCGRAGDIAGARHEADLTEALSASLGPHDRVHGLAARLAVESVDGNWGAFRDLASRAEGVTAANVDYPCQFNWRNLLACALGLARLGDERARRFEEIGRSTAVVAPPAEREPALLRLALLRADRDEMRRILELLPAGDDKFGIDGPAARLDVLLALGETERLEEEAAPYLEADGYTRAFALRALGVSRRDASLTREAVARFERMGLGWRAEETRWLAKTSTRAPI